MASTPTLVQTPKITPQSFVNADGTTKKTLATGGAAGTKLVGIMASSTDTSDRVMNLWLTRSATSYQMGAVTVPQAAGTVATVLPANLFLGLGTLPIDNDGQPYIFLESGDTLQGSAAVAVTVAKEIDVIALFGNF